MATIQGMLESINDISRNIDSYVAKCNRSSSEKLQSVDKELKLAAKNKELTAEVEKLRARQQDLMAELKELRENKNDAIAFISRMDEKVSTLQADTRSLYDQKK